jgi:ATP-binding cassette, subfamily B, bacterial MsbA
MKRFVKLLNYLVPYKWYIVQNIIYNIFGAFFALFSFAMVIPFLRVLFNNQEIVTEPMEFHLSTEYLMHTLNFYIGKLLAAHDVAGALILVSTLVVIFSLLKNGFIFAANFMLAPIRAFLVRDIRNDIYVKVLKLPLSYYTEARKGDVIARISNDVQEIEASLLSSLQMLFKDPITIIIFLAILFTISFKLTLFALIVIPLSGFMIGRIGKSLRKTTFRGQQRLGDLLALLEETLGGLRIIKAFNGEEQMKERFFHTNNHFALLIRKVVRRRYLASPLSELLATIGLMGIMAFGGALVLEGADKMDGENLILFLMIFSQIIPPAKSISTAWINVQKGMASVDRVDQLLMAEDKIEEIADAVKVEGFNDSIEFRNVSFKYDKEYVLKNISFTIKKGQTIALVGKSGSGKSTMVDLLPRFMDTSEGEIFIDGVPVRNFQLKSLRSLMGMVSQQSILFNDTFQNNIAFGNRSASLEQVINAAKVANAHDFIVETEKGYEGSVGEGGGKLSGGQKQRISIARAVLVNPPILILDEATSALDTESERLVQDAIVKLMQNRTSIVIAHRLSTIKYADLILVIDEGEIVERGTHDELINNKRGVYKKLHSMQMF